MARSIGDTDGKSIGVISEPIVTEYSFSLATDHFIVLGSDGIWDVMENEEVVNFVECYRHHCLRQDPIDTQPGQGVRISPKTACIAQLLCEEARVRWFTIVEKEDVMIDDISAVVLELQTTDQKLQPAAEINRQQTIKAEDGTVVPQSQGSSPTRGKVDPRRGSLITGSFNVAQPS